MMIVCPLASAQGTRAHETMTANKRQTTDSSFIVVTDAGFFHKILAEFVCQLLKYTPDQR